MTSDEDQSYDAIDPRVSEAMREAQRQVHDEEYEASTAVPRTRLARRHRYDQVNAHYDQLLHERELKRRQDQTDERSRLVIGALVGGVCIVAAIALIVWLLVGKAGE